MYEGRPSLSEAAFICERTTDFLPDRGSFAPCLTAGHLLEIRTGQIRRFYCEVLGCKPRVKRGEVDRFQLDDVHFCFVYQDTADLKREPCSRFTLGVTTIRKQLGGICRSLTLSDFAQHWLDVNDRSAIDRFDGTDSQTLLAYFAHRDWMNADRIGPIGRACRKHSGEAATRV
jgi:hypothetical protein